MRPAIAIGGKTGTAQKLINGHYSQTINLTSFAGVFPMDDPRYVIVVMLDEPKATPGNLRLHDRRLERRAGCQPHGQPDRADARRRARHEPRTEHGRGAAVRSGRQARREEGLTGVKLRDIADVDCDSEVTGFAIDHRKVARGQRVRRVQGRGLQRRGLHRPGGRARRGRRRRAARSEGRARPAPRRSRAAAAVRRARRQILRALSGDRRRGHRHQRQDLDRRDDAPDLAHVGSPLRLDRDAWRDHRPTTR